MALYKTLAGMTRDDRLRGKGIVTPGASGGAMNQ